jgi:hypothetical protein
MYFFGMRDFRKRCLFVGLLAACAPALTACGYSTVEGIELVSRGAPVAEYDSSAYKLVFSPRNCFDPDADCDLDVEVHLYAFGDMVAAAPDSLRIRLPTRDTVLVLDTADTSTGRLWLWWRNVAAPRETADGQKIRTYYWLLAWNVARVSVDDTLTLSFTGHARRADGTLDTLRIRQPYVVKRFRERVFVSI